MQRAARAESASIPHRGSGGADHAASRLITHRLTTPSFTEPRQHSTIDGNVENLATLALARPGHNFSRVAVFPPATGGMPATTPETRSQPNGPSSQPLSPSLGSPRWSQTSWLAGESEENPSRPIRRQGEPVPYRAHMERVFGADFSAVTVFRGAPGLLAQVGAKAAAWPDTVAFASATPSPQMVAHELAHVLQYRNDPHRILGRQGTVRNNDPAEVEARHAARHLDSGVLTRPRVRPPAVPMLYTDEEDLDSEEFLQDRPPQFNNEEVGTWGNTWSATLVARERLAISYPEKDRSYAVVEGIAQRAPIVILHEYGRLWLYRLEWEGLSGRYSRFTNAETIFHEGTHERGDYSVSNVQGRPEVEAFVTEDGGVLSPPGAGKLFLHTGGEFEDPLVSKFHNARAFLDGLQKGLEGADFPELAQKLRNMAALNTVFPAPFAIGALHGLANEIIELAQWLNPQQWKAAEAAARQTILILNDPDGEELAATLGEEFGRSQAATLEQLLQQSLPVFAYEVGKLIGPTIIEIVLAFIGIEIGPVAVFQKSVAAAKAMPRFAEMLRGARTAFPDIPDRPGFTRNVEGEGAEITGELTEGSSERDFVPLAPTSHALPDLSPEEQALLVRTGNRDEFPGKLPDDLALQELAIVKRAEKVPITESGRKYINEVDLGNGHKWKEQPNGTWCRFSNGATNCTILVEEPGPRPPGTVVAYAATKAALRDIYFAWAENRVAENVEMVLLRSRRTLTYPERTYPQGTYTVVVGDVDEGAYPGESKDWITIAHSHAGAPDQPGYVNPSPKDLSLSLRGASDLSRVRIRKWVHSQTPQGEWREVEYGYDLDRDMHYIQPSGGGPQFFEGLKAPDVKQGDLLLYEELRKSGRISERNKLMIEQNAIEYYLGWYARQFE